MRRGSAVAVYLLLAGCASETVEGSAAELLTPIVRAGPASGLDSVVLASSDGENAVVVAIRYGAEFVVSFHRIGLDGHPLGEPLQWRGDPGPFPPTVVAHAGSFYVGGPARIVLRPDDTVEEHAFDGVGQSTVRGLLFSTDDEILMVPDTGPPVSHSTTHRTEGVPPDTTGPALVVADDEGAVLDVMTRYDPSKNGYQLIAWSIPWGSTQLASAPVDLDAPLANQPLVGWSCGVSCWAVLGEIGPLTVIEGVGEQLRATQIDRPVANETLIPWEGGVLSMGADVRRWSRRLEGGELVLSKGELGRVGWHASHLRDDRFLLLALGDEWFFTRVLSVPAP